jgi:hypothetical protein
VIALICVVVVCGTVLAAVIVVARTRVALMPPREEIELRAAKAKTAIDLEKWKQDWILQQRRDGERPALPPATQEVLPR